MKKQIDKAGLRYFRIDFFRGLAIYMIFVDHVVGDPLGKFTYRMIGFSDAAELFVFISGLACGIAYSKIFARQGFYGLTVAIAIRAGRIYFCYTLSSIATILLVTAAMKYAGLHEHFGIATDQPLTAILSALLLTAPPDFPGILILYIVLTGTVLPALVVARGQYRGLALVGSGMIWVASQFFSGYAEPPTHWLFVNPFAWQFLFAIGVTLGINWEAQPTMNAFCFRPVVVVAWAVFLGALIYRFLAARSGFNIESLRLDSSIAGEMKEKLSPVRLAHFLSVAFLVEIYFRRDSALLKWRIFKPLIDTGMHSLEVFSLSIVLTMIANIFVLTRASSLGDRLVIDAVAFLLLALTAAALARRRALALRHEGSESGLTATEHSATGPGILPRLEDTVTRSSVTRS